MNSKEELKKMYKKEYGNDDFIFIFCHDTKNGCVSLIKKDKYYAFLQITHGILIHNDLMQSKCKEDAIDTYNTYLGILC